MKSIENTSPASQNVFPHIDEIAPLNDEDHARLNDIREVLRKHERLHRFGVTLLHRHFDLNLTDDGIVVHPSKTADSTAISLLIEYTPELESVIARAKKIKPQIGEGNYLLRTQSGSGYSADGFSANFRRAMDKAIRDHGIARFSFHDIRRKSASDSESVRQAQERLGHADEATTRRYYIARPVRVRPLR